MDLTFESVNVSIGDRKILSNVTGFAKAGTLTSLMGCSGSGKTTLLTTLARRFEPNLKYEGSIRYGGEKWNTTWNNRRTMAFVRQDDIVPGYLTVQEHLDFSSKLRLEVSEEVRKERVEKVISRLQLEKCRNTLLGGADARGVSGGERKRTSIANELLTEPKILFTDEPTSGLDSTLSVVVVDILKELANKDGLTVITTIHSPSSSIFDRFDALIILDEGQIFYRGNAKGLVPYLSDTLGKAVPSTYNPADYVMDILVLDTDHRKDPKLLLAMEQFRDIDDSTFNHSLATTTTTENGGLKKRSKSSRIRRELIGGLSTIFKPGQENGEERNQKYAQPFITQTILLTKRMWKKHKNEMFTKEQIGSTFGLAAISGLMFFQLAYNEVNIFSRVSLSLWFVGTDMYLGTFSGIFAFHDEIPLLKKELYDGAYSVSAHIVAKQFVIFPNNSFWSVVFCILVLLCSGIASTFGLAVLILIQNQFEVLLFQGIGLLISSVVPMSGLVVTSVVVVTYFFAFNGFFVPYILMPAWYQWLRWPCFLVYPFNLVLQIVFPPTVEYKCGSPSAYPTCQNNGSVITGADILKQYNVDLSIAACISTIIVAGIIFRILAGLIFARNMRPVKGMTENTPRNSCWTKICDMCSCQTLSRCCKTREKNALTKPEVDEKQDPPTTINSNDNIQVV